MGFRYFIETDVPKSERPACGAKTRSGTPCKAKVVKGRKRCRLHGGLSTGPKTAEGIARIKEVQQRRWQKRQTSI